MYDSVQSSDRRSSGFHGSVALRPTQEPTPLRRLRRKVVRSSGWRPLRLCGVECLGGDRYCRDTHQRTKVPGPLARGRKE